jgi:hypothetical protein
MAPNDTLQLTAGKSWGGEDVLVLYNLCCCERSLQMLRDHAKSYETIQARIPYSTNGDERDDFKRAVFLVMNPLLLGLGVRIISIQEPHEVCEEDYDLTKPRERARYQREARVGNPRDLGGADDRLELWCDEPALVLQALTVDPRLLNLQPFHPVTAVEPSAAPRVAVLG